jgi:glutathione synthase/RimK-type ligase-like ATP-grasp enzyme
MGQLLSYRPRRLSNDRPNPAYELKPWHIHINWGCSTQNVIKASKVINDYDKVRIAGNKLSTFQVLQGKEGIRIPEWTTSTDTVRGWLDADKSTVVVRASLTGHSGAGISLLNPGHGAIPQAPLYVKYVKKQQEFRVHVAFGEVIDVQEKRQRKNYDGETDFQVRNHHTGWVYCREDIREPESLRGMAKAVVSSLELNFGAVDIIYNAKRDECYVLEVNTAPGLEGSTVDKYAEAFVKALK